MPLRGIVIPPSGFQRARLLSSATRVSSIEYLSMVIRNDRLNGNFLRDVSNEDFSIDGEILSTV